MAGPGDPKGLGIDCTKHIEVNKTVIERCNQSVSQRMSQPHQIIVVAGGIDDDQAVGTSQCINCASQSLPADGLILEADIIGAAKTKMIGNIKVAGDAVGPGSPVLDVMREASLSRIEVNCGDTLARLHQRNRDVHGDGGFAGAAFFIGNDDDSGGRHQSLNEWLRRFDGIIRLDSSISRKLYDVLTSWCTQQSC